MSPGYIADYLAADMVYGVLLAIMLVAIGRLVFTYARIKTSLLRGLSDGEYRRASFEEFPHAILSVIRQRTSEFEALGFVRVADFSVARATTSPVTGCARLLFNTEARCTAIIIQNYSRSQYLSTYSAISSDLGTEWTVSHADYALLPAAWLMRHPRMIFRMLPGATVADIFSAHLKMRQQIAQDLGLSILPPMSYEAHLASTSKVVAEKRAILEGKSAWRCVLDFLSARFRPRFEWLGDYPAAAAQKRAG